ncbi:MAG: RES family NAD+ phosphorylase [Actinomycetota bacterium]|nr:RES family NAD+ phosphorylase [Actinomycetota bacterium]
MDVDAIAVAGDWIRHVPHAAALLGRAPVATDGRWQRASVVRALYLADEPDTAIAEWYVLAELGVPPARRIPHDHHISAIDLKLANLSDDTRLAAVGLDAPRPAGGTWPASQAVARTFDATAGRAWSHPVPRARARSSPASSTTTRGRRRAVARAIGRDHRHSATTPRHDHLTADFTQLKAPSRALRHLPTGLEVSPRLPSPTVMAKIRRPPPEGQLGNGSSPRY